MRKLRVIVLMLCVLGALCGAGLPAPAAAAGLPPPVADCSAHARLLHHYTPSQLRQALKAIPADVAEYTNCPDVINQALLTELKFLRSGGSGGSAGSLFPGWLIAVLAVMALTGSGTAALAARTRRRAA
jgi:hypothetical protein